MADLADNYGVLHITLCSKKCRPWR